MLKQSSLIVSSRTPWQHTTVYNPYLSHQTSVPTPSAQHVSTKDLVEASDPGRPAAAATRGLSPHTSVQRLPPAAGHRRGTARGERPRAGAQGAGGGGKHRGDGTTAVAGTGMSLVVRRCRYGIDTEHLFFMLKPMFNIENGTQWMKMG